MKDAGDFDKVTILKPYSFVLVDEDKETVAELLLIDDDTLLVDDELLKGLDKRTGRVSEKLVGEITMFDCTAWPCRSNYHLIKRIIGS